MPKQIGNVQLMQKMNRLRVLNYIRRNPDTSRPVISEQTGLSLASITNITTYLLDKGILVESGIEPAARVGRKSTLLRFCSEAYGLIFASLSESSADIFYTDLEGRIIYSKKVDIAVKSSEEFISVSLKCVHDLLERFGAEKTLAIGINFSGMVLNGSRFVLSSSMKWKELDIKRIFEESTGLSVFVENISIIRAVWYSSSHEDICSKNMIFVDLENGIGAVHIDCGVVRASVLGEIGHTTVEKDGIECFCGNRGCLEAMCSVERISEIYNTLSGKRAESIREIARLYDCGDPSACDAVEQCGNYLGIGLANLVSLFHPDVLVINRGQFSELGCIFDIAEKEMGKRAYSALLQDMDIRYVNTDLVKTVAGAAFETCDRLFDISFPNNPIE